MDRDKGVTSAASPQGEGHASRLIRFRQTGQAGGSQRRFLTQRRHTHVTKSAQFHTNDTQAVGMCDAAKHPSNETNRQESKGANAVPWKKMEVVLVLANKDCVASVVAACEPRNHIAVLELCRERKMEEIDEGRERERGS